MELNWIVSFPASCLHAAEIVSRGGPVADVPFATALRPAACRLNALTESRNQPRDEAWERLIDAAVDQQPDHVPTRDEAANSSSLSAPSSNAPSSNGNSDIASCIADLTATVARLAPAMPGQLPLRVRPLREQWEARGPGLLAAVERLAGGDWLARRAGVVVVHPMSGGAAMAHPASGFVRLEGMLVNAVPELPEVVRLGWALCQLPASGRTPTCPAPTKIRFATLPLVLAAAGMVELTSEDLPSLMHRAISSWQLAKPSQFVTRLLDWWGEHDEPGGFARSVETAPVECGVDS